MQVFDAETGEFINSWGINTGMIDSSGGAWGAHGIAIEECVTKCTEDKYDKLRVYIDDFAKFTLSTFGAGKGEWLF